MLFRGGMMSTTGATCRARPRSTAGAKHGVFTNTAPTAPPGRADHPDCSCASLGGPRPRFSPISAAFTIVFRDRHSGRRHIINNCEAPTARRASRAWEIIEKVILGLCFARVHADLDGRGQHGELGEKQFLFVLEKRLISSSRFSGGFYFLFFATRGLLSRAAFPLFLLRGLSAPSFRARPRRRSPM